MATDSQHAPADSTRQPDSRSGELVEFETFIEGQLHKTRNEVRSVDIAAMVMVLLAGSLAYLLLAVLVDHWASGGGLGFWGRLLLLVGFLAGATWWTATQIAPLLVKRINPLYAAATIENSRPSLKNGLVNFLLFRANPSGVHAKVYAGIEEQAATSLAGVEVASAVDRSRLIRLGYILVGLLFVAALYTFLSPKDLFRSVGRVAMPWADIGPSTRTRIEDVTPGDAEAFRGQQVTVAAHVAGLPEGDAVVLYYTTSDRQIVDRAVSMTAADGYQQYQALLPAGDTALQQSLSYRIEAGDAVTRTYAIDVVAAPTIVVESIEYHYPEYTGLLTQRVEHQGDIKAIEGTQVVVTALANQDIASAHIDFECDQKLDQRMRIDGHRADAAFRLVFDKERLAGEHGSYQVMFKNSEGRANPQPVRHQIEVTRDLPPEIQFVAPKSDSIDVPQNAAVDLEVIATDPDFALARVTLSARRGGKPLVDAKLLDETWRGQFVKKYRFRPQQFGLEAGDVVEYWATAEDNKTPTPGTTETSRRRLRITSPSNQGQQDAQDQLAKNEPSGDDPQQQDDSDARRDRGDGSRNASEQPNFDDQEPPAADGQQPPEDRQPSEGQQRDQGDGQGGKEQGEGGQGAERAQQDGEGEPQDGGQRSGESGERGEAGQDGESGDGQQGGQDDSVPSDGTSDGDAFDRILQHRDQNRDATDDTQRRQGGGDPEPGANDRRQGSPDQSGQQDQSDERQGEAGQRGNDDTSRQRDAGQQDSDQQDAGQQDRQPADRDARGDDDRADQQQGAEQAEDQQGNRQQQRDGQQRNDAPRNGQQQRDGQPGGDQQQRQPGDSAQQRKQPQRGGEQSGEQQDKSEPSRPGNEQRPGERGSESGDAQQGDQQSDSQGARQQDRQGGGEKSGSRDQQSSDEPGQGQTGQSQPDAKNKSTDRTDTERQSGPGDPDSQQPSDKSDPSQPDSRSGATRDNNTRPDGTPQDPATKGQGGQSKDDSTRSPDQKPGQDGEQRPDARGGDGEQDKGESGAGQSSQDNNGSPRPQKANRPRRKSQQPGAESERDQDNQQEQSPSQSDHESDSEGQEDGDQSGGGKRGGGQKANKPGTGGAGQNTAADEGAGQSEQAGDGESSDRAGDDRQSDKQTGRSGQQQGPGSRQGSADDATNDKQQPQGDDSAPDDTGEQSPPDGAPSGAGQQSSGTPGGAGESPGGGRGQSQTPPPEREWQPSEDVAEEANLEYAKKATDLALEHLKNELQKDRPDQDLLDRLGWTRQEAEQFVKRWEAMRKQAGTEGPQGNKARRDLDDTLRSLGLRPRSTTLGSNSARDDQSRGYKESRRTAPPAEYSEAFKAYTQGTARSGK